MTRAPLPPPAPKNPAGLDDIALLNLTFQAWDDVYGAVLRETYGPAAAEARYDQRGHATEALRLVAHQRSLAMAQWIAAVQVAKTTRKVAQ